MLLSSPAFPLSIADKDIYNSAMKLVTSKGRNSLSISDKKISYVPFWFFDYSVYSKKEADANHSKSSGAMNASTNEFDESVAALTKSLPKEMSNEIQDSPLIEVLKPKSSRNDARKAALFGVASQHNTSPENVAITSIELYFIPFWKITAVVDGKQHKLALNAFSGEFLGDGGLTVKEKSLQEITQETLTELKTPQGWVSNLKSLYNSAANFFTKTLNFAGIKKLDIIDAAILVLLIVLVLVLLKII
jgi:hypothetical protein